MKKSDFVFLCIVLFIFTPFFLFPDLYKMYQQLNTNHGMCTSFFKFAILSTLGELLGLRISSGHYLQKGFGILPRALVWGIFGIGINMAFIIFSNGVLSLASYMGVNHPIEIMNSSFTFEKLLLAFTISVILNSIFAPIFMTLHKITDTHILATGGTLHGFFSPIPIGNILQHLNWKVQWNFVFKKTIPLFWYPAHTITFLLPEELRVLFAALLGVALGIILAIAARKSH